MKIFAGLEIKKAFTFRGLLFLVIAFIVVVYFSIEGGYKYQKAINKGEIFTQTEKIKVKSFQRYSQYGTYGIGITLNPEKTFALFSDSGAFQEIMFRGDSGERFHLYSNKKGANIFREKLKGTDFSGVIFWICAFLSIYIGYNSIKNKYNLRFLAHIFGKSRILFSKVGISVLIVNVIFLSFLVLSLVVLHLYGVNIDISQLLCFIIIALGTFTFLTIWGSAIGRFKAKNRLPALLITFIVIVGAPFLIWKITDVKANEIMFNEVLEQKNVKTIMNIEKIYKEKFKPFKDGKIPEKKLLEFVESNLENEHKEIAERESNMAEEMHSKVKWCHFLSSLFPITAYYMTCTEHSCQGFLNALDFYSHVRKKKIGFINYYAQKRFYERQTGKIEPFLKDNEYTYKSNPKIPYYFGFGVFLVLIYIAATLFFAYNRYNRIFKASGKVKGGFKLPFVIGLLTYHITRDPEIFEYIYECAIGVCACNITINEDSIQKIDFIYLPHHSKIPYSRDELIKLLRLDQSVYGKLEKWELLIQWAVNNASYTGKVLLLQNFLEGLFDEDVMKIKSLLFKHEIAALNVGSDIHHYRNLADVKSSWSCDKTVEKKRINDICENEKIDISEIKVFYN